MDSWEYIILQWINCLYGNTNDCIKTVEELQDGKAYYNLIGKVKPWNYEDCNGSQKMMVLQYLKEEYPSFKFNNKNDIIENLYLASLILSKVSLEPIFHKSLCTNLRPDMQSKIKSILESIYPLGKHVTGEDLCNIFLPANKTDVKSFSTKPKRILEEFFNSPAIRSVHSDKKIYEQTKQLRHLRAEIETLRYEKSELIEDIKSQKKQIEELQKKLQETLSEIKLLCAENHKNDTNNTSYEVQDAKVLESSYEEELKSLEKYVAELQNDNCQLQDEKSHLMNEIKIYKAKCKIVETENINNEQIIESMVFQIEKKDDELTELKMRHEELSNYLREKSNAHFYNQSFEVDDKVICEMSLNKSETLSSVIEIQLQDCKKELINMQNKFRYINILLTILLEEYIKLKGKAEILSANNIRIQCLNEKKCIIVEEKENLNEFEFEQNFEIEEQSNLIDLKNNDNFISNEVKNSFKDILKNKFNKNNAGKQLKSNIDFTLNKGKNTDNYTSISSSSLDMSNFLQKYNSNTNINYSNKNILTENWNTRLFCFSKILLQKIANNLETNARENYNFNNLFFKVTQYICSFNNGQNNTELFRFLESNFRNNTNPFDVCGSSSTNITEYNCTFNNAINAPVTVQKSTSSCSKSIQTENKYNEVLLYRLNLKSLKSTWDSLFECINHDLKINKVLTLLKANWCYVLEMLNSISVHDSCIQTEFKQLFVKKATIEREVKNVCLKNLQILSLNLISAVQFVTILSKDCQTALFSSVILHESIDNLFLTTSSDFSSIFDSKLNIEHKKYIKNKIIDIKRRINNFQYLIKLYERKYLVNSTSANVPEDNHAKNLNTCEDSAKKGNIKVETQSLMKDEKMSNIHKSSDDNINIIETPQVQTYLKEIHEKYENKLEKMKEKMKAAYNNQITMLKKEQEIAATNKLEALQTKIENQCYKHTEELKKYKKHISELTTQLWDVGEKLIIEKQKNEGNVQKLKELKTRKDHSEIPKTRIINHEFESFDNKENFVTNIHDDRSVRHSIDPSSMNKMQSVRGFQIMGNAFRTEDEEGEVFDTTYLTDMQTSRNTSTIDTDRLSILQMRNAKCKPHLKSSYPIEMQFHPVPLTEDEIKTGSTSEEVFNDSLSQSLLTGKKVKRKDRTRNTTETPRRSRRFSNIFRKPRLSIDRK